MSNFICCAVPPHVLDDIVAGGDEEARGHAQATLDTQQLIHDQRTNLATKPDLTGSENTIVPGYILQDLLNAEGVHHYVTQYAEENLAGKGQDQDLANVTLTAKPPNFIQSIYDMESQMPADPKQDVMQSLPGKLLHSEGQPMPTDNAATQVYLSTLRVLQFLKNVFNHESLDGQGMPIVSSVHFKKNLANAYWIGTEPDRTYNQMIYGDGTGLVGNFTNCIDIIGHEMTHAITQFNTGLVYKDESGALNEHISDVFGVMAKQWDENIKAKDADWLIGEGCFMPDHKGVALRNMKDPGTAYDKLPELGGKDPQPADYKSLLSYQRSFTHTARLAKDNGGCHIFSGVPNRAFVLSSLAFDGYSWEKAGKIWWTTITTHRITPTCSFVEFADTTVTVAQELFGDGAAASIREAWNKVGVTKKT